MFRCDMDRRYVKLAALLAVEAGLWLAVAGGCGPAGPGRTGDRASATDGQPGARKNLAASGVVLTDYLLKGVVRKVEKDNGHVTIRHQAIPGFMDAMTMRFSLKDSALLAELRPGDEVEGTLRVETRGGVVNDYELRGLAVTKPAPRQAMIIDLAKGKMQLRAAPKRLEVGDPVADFAMTMQDGKLVRLADLRGKVVALTFIYTRCPLPDFCPLMDRKFSALAQSIGAFPERAKYIRLISLSFDPEHDTPEILRKHALIRGATPPLWSYAVASHEELAKIAPALGLFYGPTQGEVAHNLCTAVIDREGKLARVEVGTQSNRWETADLLKTVYSLIPTSGK
ncbi:MAG: copper-binding protein [Isosphaeraceae bacterium]